MSDLYDRIKKLTKEEFWNLVNQNICVGCRKDVNNNHAHSHYILCHGCSNSTELSEKEFHDLINMFGSYGAYEKKSRFMKFLIKLFGVTEKK